MPAAQIYPPSAGSLAALPGGKSPLFVVGIVGSDSCAAAAVGNRLANAQVFRLPGDACGPARDQCSVEMYHDVEHGVLYLIVASELTAMASVEQHEAIEQAGLALLAASHLACRERVHSVRREHTQQRTCEQQIRMHV